MTIMMTTIKIIGIEIEDFLAPYLTGNLIARTAEP